MRLLRKSTREIWSKNIDDLVERLKKENHTNHSHQLGYISLKSNGKTSTIRNCMLRGQK